MNIALIGYGRMGKEIETIAQGKKIPITHIFTRDNNAGGKGLTKQSLNNVDVCIEFTTPMEAYTNITTAIQAGKNVVCGTTGWLDRMPEVKKLVEEHKTGFLYAANFSIGMNIFFQVVANAAYLVDKFDMYDAFIQETHHADKTDAPSGTALHLASLLLQNISRKKEIISETPHKGLLPHQLHVTSTRAGHWIGQHSIVFDSEEDIIQLTHTARSRRGFAMGALVAAQWLEHKKGFFTMKDVIL